MIRLNDRIARLNGFLTQDHTIGYGLRYDGVDDFVDIGLLSILPTTPTSPVSFNFIFKTGNSFEVMNMLLGQNISAEIKGYWIYYNNQTKKITIILWVTGSIGQAGEISVELNPNTIYNISFNCVGIASYLITINGVSQFVNINNFGILNFSDSQTITSRYTIGRVLNGYLYTNRFIFYDFKIFNKNLFQNEIDLLYFSKGCIIPTTARANLIANYSFEQKTGTTLLDSSGNNLHGTLTNFANTTPSAGNAWVDEQGNSILT